MGPSFEQTIFESTSPKDLLCQVWLNGHIGSGKEENVKSLRKRQRR